MTQVGDDGDHPSHLPKAQLMRIIKPRVDEILELARDRLTAAGQKPHRGLRIVITGGASQLTGVTEAAKRILLGQVRVGRPLGIQGVPSPRRIQHFQRPSA